jgi:ABC-type microcin C transport system duplicated ATPase subunit YejF
VTVPPPQNGALLEVKRLKKYFPVKKGLFSRVTGHVRAVDDISFVVRRKETLGLVGESGCGKTTAGRTILRLLEPTAGEVTFEGVPLFQLRSEALRQMRRNMQIIFQDPYGSLNPRMTVEGIVGEALSVHGIARGSARRALVKELLDKVGLNPNQLNRYPHASASRGRSRSGRASLCATSR